MHGRGRLLLRLAGLATYDRPHRWISTESFRVVDILIACQAAVNRLTQQGQDAVLLVLAKSRISHAHRTRLGQMQRIIKFPIYQQPSVGADLASQERQLQSTVEIDPQVPDLAFTRGSLPSALGKRY